MNGIDLLEEFRQSHSESAFSDLVRRYTNLVYSVAQRRLANESLAQEATQTAFIRLAKSPPKLRSDAELIGWLHRTTIHLSIDLWRSESRRRAREEQAVAMQPQPNEDASWKALAPAIDEALDELNDTDRQTLLRRFFNGQSMRDVGAAFGISEDAAKMRVARALERLRTQLNARGVTCTAAGLGAFLVEKSIAAAPSSVVAALEVFPFPVEGGAGATAATDGLGMLSGSKLMMGFGALLVVGLTALLVVQLETGPNLVRSATRRSVVDVAMNGETVTPPATAKSPGPLANEQPDPLQLLRGVARARQRIVSGTIGLQVDSQNAFPTYTETNRLRISAIFEGSKRRFEQFGREYAYVYDPLRAEEIEAKTKAFGSDREGAVQAGLLTGFEAHSVTIYDGETVMQYRETDGEPQGATIDAASKGSSTSVFDPRCLGLRPWLSPNSTVESCLGLNSSSSAPELVGREIVDGVACWHVRQVSGEDLDFWIDGAHPTRVLKVQSNHEVALCTYDSANERDSLPTQVRSSSLTSESRSHETRILRTETQWNTSATPATWTLAGLGMKIGTAVVDIRIHRRVGYWTGSELSESLPAKKARTSVTAPTLEEMLSILETEPGSANGLDAATWILVNTPDGPAVEKAAGVIVHEHIRSPELGGLCQQLERMRPRCTLNVLQSVLKENPHPDVRARACFSLAVLRKDACQDGGDAKLTAEADQLFDRVIQEFGRTGRLGAELARKAQIELSELRRLTIGKAAPDFAGADLKGDPIKLSDYRGKVVVLVFWTQSTVDGPEDHKRLFAKLTNQPFAWIGVNCDAELNTALATVEKAQIAWPVVWDGRSGPIATDWNVGRWPLVFVLDRQGIIRHRGLRDRPLADAVAALLAEF